MLFAAAVLGVLAGAWIYIVLGEADRRLVSGN